MASQIEARKGETMKRQCEVTVRRPDGTVETLVHPNIPVMTDTLWDQMVAAMREADRGECLSYVNETIETEGDRQRTEQRRKECEYDDLHNEGGDGYNPHRLPSVGADATPYHKGDNLEE